MDIVITYVNGRDPVWQKDYEKFTNRPVMDKRFRDWATLKYLLRGIETAMPFIRNVYLIVSHESQMPEWGDRENLHMVLHKDIIPAAYLPTFNSTTIEMFLHRIDSLDEEFLYFNDDMFPVGECRPTDFFRDGKAVIGISKHLLVTGMYKRQCRSSDRLVRKALGIPHSACFVRPQHTCTPMLKSENGKIFLQAEKEILGSLSRLRSGGNLTQYLFADYLYYGGKLIPDKISNKHFSLAIASAHEISSFIENPSRKLVCINDVHLSEKRYEVLREAILNAFEKRFPQKSRFEK